MFFFVYWKLKRMSYHILSFYLKKKLLKFISIKIEWSCIFFKWNNLSEIKEKFWDIVQRKKRYIELPWKLYDFLWKRSLSLHGLKNTCTLKIVFFRWQKMHISNLKNIYNFPPVTFIKRKKKIIFWYTIIFKISKLSYLLKGFKSLVVIMLDS